METTHIYSYPDNLPEELYEVWDSLSDKHHGDPALFREWVEKALEYFFEQHGH